MHDLWLLAAAHLALITGIVATTSALIIRCTSGTESRLYVDRRVRTRRWWSR